MRSVNTERYTITSNRESGFGRYDVMRKPFSAKDTAYILEFKVHDSEDEKDLRETVKAAHQQIQEKKYDTSLLAKGDSEGKYQTLWVCISGKRSVGWMISEIAI